MEVEAEWGWAEEGGGQDIPHGKTSIRNSRIRKTHIIKSEEITHTAIKTNYASISSSLHSLLAPRDIFKFLKLRNISWYANVKKFRIQFQFHLELV